jgi:hypothetical protein
VEEVQGREDWLMVFSDGDYLYFIRVRSRSIFLAMGNVATKVRKESAAPSRKATPGSDAGHCWFDGVCGSLRQHGRR